MVTLLRTLCGPLLRSALALSSPASLGVEPASRLASGDRF